MKLVLYSILIGILFLATDCHEKKWFRNLHVQGRVVNYMTGQPVGGGMNVYLRASQKHSASSYSEARYLIGTTTTNNDGTFSFDTDAYTSGSYFILLDQDYNRPVGADATFSSKGGNVNLGDIRGGTYDFIFKIRLTSTTGACGKVYDGYFESNPQPVHLLAGHDTSIIYHFPWKYIYYRYNKENFEGKIGYTVYTESCFNHDELSHTDYQLSGFSEDTLQASFTY